MRFYFLVIAGLLTGCGNDDPCFGKRDLFASPDGLQLTVGEHEAGWGRSDCFLCHQTATLHEANCSSVDVDVAAIEYDVNDTSTCTGCHGDNGVAAWSTDDDTGEDDTGE